MNNNYNKYFTETENGLDIEANNINANCITSKSNKFSLDSEGNLMVNSITAAVNNQGTINFDTIYPIGSIYMSVNNVNPSTLFEGTTWEKIVDRFLVGAGNKYSLGGTGGTETHSHSSGNLITNLNFEGGCAKYYYVPDRSTDFNYAEKFTFTESSSSGTLYGGVKIHGNTGGSSNIPPYLAINIWKRVS